jgi:hypothetical protein
MTVSYRKFKPLDVSTFIPMNIFDDGAKLRTIYASDFSDVYTIFDEGGEMGIVGCTPIWPGVANMWTLLGEDIKREPKAFSLLVGVLIEEMFAKHNLRRADAHVRVGYSNGVSWIEKFGFVREGVMRRYLPDGADAYLYARYC